MRGCRPVLWHRTSSGGLKSAVCLLITPIDLLFPFPNENQELIARPCNRSWYLPYRGTKLWLYICVVYQCGLIKEYGSPFQGALCAQRRAILQLYPSCNLLTCTNMVLLFQHDLAEFILGSERLCRSIQLFTVYPTAIWTDKRPLSPERSMGSWTGSSGLETAKRLVYNGETQC